MDGRVKTLHPKIHGGLLGRRDVDDAVMRKHGIEPIDLLVVNLYPFAATVAKPGCTLDDAIENIDIGGPAMVRAAAKNHDRVDGGRRPARLRRGARRAGAQRRRGVGGDAQAARREGVRAHGAATTPRSRATSARVDEGAGEFPAIARAAVPASAWTCATARIRTRARRSTASRTRTGASIGAAKQLQGKELSYNNIADADTAFECVRQFDGPACVIVKHANPCGVAIASDTLAAYDRAYRDRSRRPRSAASSPSTARSTAATARAIVERQFVEVIIAPAVDADALELCARKENVRVLVTGGARAEQRPITSTAASTAACWCRRAMRGMVAQGRSARWSRKRQPTPPSSTTCCSRGRSASTSSRTPSCIAKDAHDVGVGAGQMSRVVLDAASPR